MRLVNRPLAVILAAALAVAAIIVIIEVVAVHLKGGPVLLHWTTWYQWAHKTRWNQLVIQVWSVILIVIGAAILVVELKPRRVTRLALHSGQDATDAGVTRRGLARTLGAAPPASTGYPPPRSPSAAAVPGSPPPPPPAAGPPPKRSASQSPRPCRTS